jgi:DNA-binding transcriptional regulator YiaG
MGHQHVSSFPLYFGEHFQWNRIDAPFKVSLDDPVPECETAEHISPAIRIPDPEGLLRAVILARVLHQRRFSGGDIRFLRKAVGVKQREIAQAIEVDPVTMSRCENGAQRLGRAREKLLRIFLLQTCIKLHTIERQDERNILEESLGKVFNVVHPPSLDCEEQVLELRFVRERSASAGDGKREAWEWKAVEKSTGSELQDTERREMAVRYLELVEPDSRDTIVVCQSTDSKGLRGPDTGENLACGSCRAVMLESMSAETAYETIDDSRRLVIQCLCGATNLVPNA